MRVSLRLSLLAPVCAYAFTACGASPGKSLFIPLQHYPLTIEASINGAPSTALLSSQALNLPNIGDSAVLTVLENGSQVSFSLSPASSCTNIVTISPSSTAAQQTVTSTGTGFCTAKVQSIDGSSTTLTIAALPPP